MYNKLFTKILDSTIWLQPDQTRLVWITLIAAMDEDGFCAFGAVENLSGRARISLDATKEAVRALESPDPNAPEQEFEGRRIERVDGGWFVLNASKYRDMVSRVLIRESNKERQRQWRAKRGKSDSVTARNALSQNVTFPSATDIDPSIDRLKEGVKGKPDVTPSRYVTLRNVTQTEARDEDWLASLISNPAYQGINVTHEFSKMQAWCGVNNKQPTRRRFINWLNRIERPMAGTSNGRTEAATAQQHRDEPWGTPV